MYFIDALRRGLYLVEVERHVPWHRAVEPGLCEARPLVLELVRPAGVALAHSSHPGIDGLETAPTPVNRCVVAATLEASPAALLVGADVQTVDHMHSQGHEGVCVFVDVVLGMVCCLVWHCELETCI